MRSIKEALRDLQQQRRSARHGERATTRGERAHRDAEAKARFSEYQRSKGGHRDGGDPAAPPDSEPSGAVHAERRGLARVAPR
jgi:hypothetical protein